MMIKPIEILQRKLGHKAPKTQTQDPEIVFLEPETTTLLQSLKEPTETLNDTIKRLAKFYQAALWARGEAS